MKRKILLVMLYTVAVASLTVVLIERNSYASSPTECFQPVSNGVVYHITSELSTVNSDKSNNPVLSQPSVSVFSTTVEELHSESEYITESDNTEYSSDYSETIYVSPIQNTEQCEAPAVEVYAPVIVSDFSEPSSTNAGEWDVL